MHLPSDHEDPYALGLTIMAETRKKHMKATFIRAERVEQEREFQEPRRVGR